MMSWVTVVAIIAVFLAVVLFLATRYKVAGETSEVLIVKKMNGDIVVSKTGAVVWPIINTYQKFSISRRIINIYSGSEKNVAKEDGKVTKIGSGIHCKDNMRADLQVSFYLNAGLIEDIAKNFTYEQLTSDKAFAEFFVSKLSEALKTAAREYDFIDLMDHREQFRKSVMDVLTDDLYGFTLDDVTIRSIEQTPVSELDDHNILDIQGKEKITNITSAKLASIVQIEEDALTSTTERQVKGKQSRLQLNKNLEEETAKTEREISVIRAKEKSATVESEQQEHLRQEEARIKTEQGIAVAKENTERDLKITQVQNNKNVGTEEQKARAEVRLAEIETDTQAKQKQLSNDVLLEEGNKKVAEVKAQRVSIEKSIAEQEEETQDIHAFKKAERNKQVILTEAQAEAEASSVKTVVAAKASKDKAVLDAERNQIEVDMNFRKVEKDSEAKALVAAATQKELSAQGLAEAEVKLRMAEADRAAGETAAENARNIGLAEVEVTQKRYDVMDKLPESVREHEINLKNLDISKEVQIKNIEKDEKVETARATAMADIYKGADIKIVGDTGVLKSIQDGMRAGAKIDSTINNSELLKQVAKPYIDGDKDLMDDVSKIASELKVDPNSVLSLSLAQLLTSPTASNLLSKFAGKQ